jgi:prefoldin subunit 5
MSVGRQDYEERKEGKIDAYKERARKANVIADQESNKARNMGSVIPFGQPIMIGHHSEGRHRALLKRIDTAHRKASEAYNKADYYEDKAATAENNHSISGDDPEAVERYQKKLAKLEKSQEYMKSVNKAWKQGKAALIALGLSEAESEKLANEKTKPCPSWMLGNNSAEIRRVKEKLETLKKLDGMEAENIKFNGGEMFVNVGINRVQIIFDDIPVLEKRALLKSHGFKWSPSEKAWQRQRTLNGVNAAKRLIAAHFNT